MFGNRRRRDPSNPHLNGLNADPSAATAAAQAFLKNQASNNALSSAAAAAALRARPTTPTSVADVQTKRMLRRYGSISSIGSGGSSVAGLSRGQPGPALKRKGSSGSMSERTFRDPSPSPSQPVPSAIDAPPVPAIPSNMIPGGSTKSQRRAASLEVPIMRVSSPPPNRATGRGSSLQPTMNAKDPVGAGQRYSLPTTQELTRPESRGSVNFSYPTSSRPLSPVRQRQLTSPEPRRPPRVTSPSNQNLVYDPNTRSLLPAAEVYAIEQSIRDAANAPVKKKKKRIAAKEATGTHLADGTVGGRPRGTAVDAMMVAAKKPPSAVEQGPPVVEQLLTVSEPVPTPAVNTSVVALKDKKKKGSVSEAGNEQGPYMSFNAESDMSTRPATFSTRSGTLTKKPSIVHEDREREEEEDDTPTKAVVQSRLGENDSDQSETRTLSPTPFTQSVPGKGHEKDEGFASGACAQGRQHTQPTSFPTPSPTATLPIVATGTIVEDTEVGRVQSVSPTRTAHFASTPDSLVVKHQPPGRSISPRKSALKHSGSQHSPSPTRMSSDDQNTPGSLSVGHGQMLSEASDNSTEDHLKPKKKSVRVSFDDESNVVLGQADTPVFDDSPIIQSPQSKQWWFGIGRGKKKGFNVMEDSDEVMKPRPALPFFGSVREKKIRDVEDRPLVKPSDLIIERPSPHLLTSPTGEIVEYPLSVSNDHIVGAILSQDHSSKNAANISKSREPLPPEVTSVEGSGYVSDDSSSTHSLQESDKPDVVVAPLQSIEQEPEHTHVETQPALPSTLPTQEQETVTSHPNQEVPEITVIQPTPTLDEIDDKMEWQYVPGGWGDNSTSDSEQEPEDITPPIVDHRATHLSQAAVRTAEPVPQNHPFDSTIAGEMAAENSLRLHPAIGEESDESDESSIYSDAAEDLSYLEEVGFQSLDAVVENPVVNHCVPGQPIGTPIERPATIATEKNYKKSLPLKESTDPALAEGWDKAQQYWSGLSAEKKRVLEQEAREEPRVHAFGGKEKPAPKPKKKKQVGVQPAPVMVIHEQHQPDFRWNRTYMIAPGTKPSTEGHTAILRPSMRAEPPISPESNMRKSMRSSGTIPSSMRSSMRDQEHESKGSLQKKFRPMSYPPAEIKPNAVAVRNHIKTMSTGNAAASPAAAQRTVAPAPLPLQRKGSGDSDSSFKRNRPSKEGGTFRHSMRTSNGSAGQRQDSPMGSGRFSLRSLSPTGSTVRRPFSSSGGPPVSLPQTMRSTRRTSYSPTLRGSKDDGSSKSPLRIPLFGQSSHKPTFRKPAAQRPSRFADSSDEEEHSTFQSRFVDSSDDEEILPTRSTTLPRPTRPKTHSRTAVLGIPRRAGVEDGDSSDLPDSDDEKPKSPPLGIQNTRPKQILHKSSAVPTASNSLRRSGSGRGMLGISSGTTVTVPPPSHTRRGSFMNILRRNKADPHAKVRKSDAESPARRDTPLERSKTDLAALYSGNSSGRPMSPKLQKRNTGFANWPLPAPVNGSAEKDGESGRPFTADAGNGVTGVSKNGSVQPDIGTRVTTTGLEAVDLTGVSGAGLARRKKKKFGALRKMFGMDD